MKKATITETKNGLSAILDLVRNGETVLILDRGRPVARIEPIEPAQDPESLLARLERGGIVRPARRRLSRSFFESSPPSPARRTSALTLLLEERQETR
ncbi:MAG: type II toxin-antitoxin system prevent-host-death family antitoxin [Acidobacteriota bacterium]